MRIEWIKSGPDITKENVDLAEKRLLFRIPDSLIWLLSTLSNGGHPSPPLVFPIFGLEGDDEMELHGLYGIDAPRGYDLVDAVENMPPLSVTGSRMIPIGFDPLNGHLFLVEGGANSGKVRYLPYEEIPESGELSEGYAVADSIQDFANRLAPENA